MGENEKAKPSCTAKGKSFMDIVLLDFYPHDRVNTGY